MICQECAKAGKRSRVYEGYTTVTAMGVDAYWDENGKHHVHDPNSWGTAYKCSEGHAWHAWRHADCWCGWRPHEVPLQRKVAE